MGDFTLPSLPPDSVPNFLTQPNPINNNTNFPDLVTTSLFLTEKIALVKTVSQGTTTANHPSLTILMMPLTT